jgi:hypothetical protein
MANRWNDFVQRAGAGEPDDPHIRLLRGRIAAGCKVLRINLLVTPGRPPEYLVILSCQQILTEMRVPHGPSFTRWSFEAGARLETAEEEALRFAWLLRERLSPIEAEVTSDYFDSVLTHHLRELGPSRTTARLARHHAYRPNVSLALQRTIKAIDAVLTGLAEDLQRALHYFPQEAAEILDRALEAVVNERFHIEDLHDPLTPEGSRQR